MRFTVFDQEFSMEFSRAHREIPVHNDDGTTTFVLSKYPYTTIMLWRHLQGENPEVYRTATVGAWHKEKTFTLERGRLCALRAVSTTLDRVVKAAMWDAYMRRG
jgi:hypothetical protein